jgi:pSer/pThr/pTyr-binding forkhead associated (FHA) protein
MPTLKLNFKDKTLGDFALQRGISLTIGRGKKNDVIIDNLAVSKRHAKIDSAGDEFVLTDLQSKNGSFVNEQQVSSHWLKQGDIIKIGKHVLLFCYSEDEEVPENTSNEIEKTMFMDTSQYRSMVNKSKPKVEEPLKSQKRKDTIGILAFLNGGNGKIKLRKTITKIGKHRDSDIIVKGFLVGRTSASISQRPEGFFLSYVGGLAKPKVNDKRVKQATILNDLDIIDIGSTKLQFFERQPRKSKVKKLTKNQPTPQAPLA